jgi:hypothetical protein
MQERLRLCCRSRIIDAALFFHGDQVEYIDLSEQLQRHKTYHRLHLLSDRSVLSRLNVMFYSIDIP